MGENQKQPEDTSMEDSLAFFGTVTASVSHELNNVIAIMEQTAGLLEDRLAGAGDEIVIPSEKLEKIVTSLQNQAARGLTIIKSLNRFAHSADHAKCTFDVGETLQNLVKLITRLATLKSASLEAKLPKTPIEIESNPFCFQQVVVLAVKAVLENVQKGDAITVTLDKTDHGVKVTVEGPINAPGTDIIGSAELQRIIKRMPGEVTFEPTDRRLYIHLLFPE